MRAKRATIVQQGDQALAVGVQESEIARAPQAFWQHVLQDQPEELRAGSGSQFHLRGLGVSKSKADLTVTNGDDLIFPDDAPVAPQIDERSQAVAAMRLAPYLPCYLGCNGNSRSLQLSRNTH